MFIKLNFNTVQPPSIWFDSIYWIMINQSLYSSVSTGATNAGYFYNSVTTSTVNAGNFTIGTQYSISSPGTTTNWTSIGASASTTGTVFTATGQGSGNGTAYPVVLVTNLIPGSSYTILSQGNTTWTGIGASANTAGTTFIASGPGTGSGTAYLTASVALKTAISTLDYSNSEIWNTTIAGSMPVVNYNSTSTGTLTVKNTIQDDNTNSQFSWLQISATGFQHATSAGSALTYNSTSTTGITLNNASASQSWNNGTNAFCYWTYISPTTFLWAATKANNGTADRYTKSGWHMNSTTADWAVGNARQSGPFFSTQYTRLDNWNTVSNGLVPVCWTNGNTTYRPFYGMNYGYDIAYAPGTSGNLTQSFNYNPRAGASNTLFSVMNTVDATPNPNNAWGIYGAGSVNNFTSQTLTAGQNVNWGTNIKTHQDQTSLVSTTYNSTGGSSGYKFSPGYPAGVLWTYSGTKGSYTITSSINVNLSTSRGFLVTGTGIPTNPPTFLTDSNGLQTQTLSQPLNDNASGAFLTYYDPANYTFSLYSRNTIQDGSAARSQWHGIQGASLWDNAIQNGAFYRWPTATATPTGAFTMQPIVWNRSDFNNIGGLISDKSSLYLFNGDYIPGDEFTVSGVIYSIWPLADGWNQRLGLAVPKR